MTLPIRVRDEVDLDVQNACQWYETERPGLSDEFLAELIETYRKISEFPEGPSPHYRDIRVRSVQRFPYGVYYRVETECVRVIAVVHLHRGARVWKARLG